jgi:hypothetical protein
VDLSAKAGRLGVAGKIAGLSWRMRTAFRRDHDQRPIVEAESSPETTREQCLSDPFLKPVALRRTEARILTHSDLTANIKRRRENYAAIALKLANLRNAKPLFPDCGSASAPYALPLLVADPEEPYSRMRLAGLPVFRWDRVWPGTPSDPQDATTTWARGVIQVACHQSLRDGDINDLCHCLRECLAT